MLILCTSVTESVCEFLPEKLLRNLQQYKLVLIVKRESCSNRFIKE